MPAPEFIPTAEPDFLTLTQVAGRLGISRSTAYRLVQVGEFPLPVRKVGRKTVVSKAALQRLIDADLEAPTDGDTSTPTPDPSSSSAVSPAGAVS